MISSFTKGESAIRLGKNDRLKTLKCKPSKEYKALEGRRTLTT
jgi:hypothetical protein